MKKTLLALALFAATASAETKIVDLGTRKVRIRTEGSGPAVVFEAGFRSTLDSWGPVLPEVAKFARVFAYDRAGLGQSDPVPSERTYVALATELHELLQHEHVPAPFVLVGHSYGGILARVYCARYPADVRAIVFVDPMNETFINNDPEHGKNIALQEASLKDAPPGVLAEWAYLRKESAERYKDLAGVPRPNVPMALITASIDRPVSWRTTSLATYGAWIGERADSLLIVTPNSGHVVMRDEPELVTGAIRSMLFPNPLAAIMKAASNGGDAVTATFRELRASYPAGSIGPSILNTAGYSLLRQQKVTDAIKVFAFNAATFPDNANVYDSLGEAYAANGETEKAIASYRRSVELDPTNDWAKRMIEKLTAK
jgi:pimeloyl-ACP methyl ester carboxylesterase